MCSLAVFESCSVFGACGLVPVVPILATFNIGAMLDYSSWQTVHRPVLQAMTMLSESSPGACAGMVLLLHSAVIVFSAVLHAHQENRLFSHASSIADLRLRVLASQQTPHHLGHLSQGWLATF